ncbi:hypothetical protein Glove_615g19 [Diversispora epigaea]|uniref:Dolichol-phosphate mannosyltransferase subunit 3 n=1 Tax=Diversispora epigaea TaxID=1348612 RepID=A0A397G670_9GLOM|nr:hypothetical protein Glove_615g19 [Diversispora epigaea]
MTKATETVAALGIFFIIYFIFLFGVVPLPDVLQEEIIPVLPWWLLVTFGTYSLGTVGYNVFKFRDCEDAYHELMAEIQLAKDDLRSKGITVVD